MPERLEYIRPSSLPRIEGCPGSPLMEYRAIQAIPELGTLEHPAARQGTLGHMVADQTVSMIYHSPGGWREPATCLERMEGLMLGLEEWTRDATRRVVDYAVALVDRAIAAGYRVAVELERKLSGQGIAIPRGGTADVVLLLFDDDTDRPAKVWVIDYKLGYLDQGHAADHLQLSGYAVMSYDKYQPRDGVEVHLAQGRRRDFSAAAYDHQAIKAARARCIAASQAAQADCPPLCPGEACAHYCKALVVCRPAREYLMHAAHKLALFGATPEERVELDTAAKVARRFNADVRELQKAWRAQRKADRSLSHQGATQ